MEVVYTDDFLEFVVVKVNGKVFADLIPTQFWQIPPEISLIDPKYTLWGFLLFIFLHHFLISLIMFLLFSRKFESACSNPSSSHLTSWGSPEDAVYYTQHISLHCKKSKPIHVCFYSIP